MSQFALGTIYVEESIYCNVDENYIEGGEL